MKKYCIEIYIPGSRSDVIEQFNSDSTPFSISKGDLISSASFTDLGDTKLPMSLRVTDVVHLLMSSKGDMKHKVMIYTTIE